MKKAIIGILPNIKFKKNDNPYDDNYIFTNNYSTRIIEEGAIPIGILLKDGQLDKTSLDICDAFLIPGGNKMDKIHYEVVEYAIKNNKPLLGICLGMQAIACYSKLKDIAISKNIEPTIDNLIKLRKELQEENIYMLEQLPKGNIHGEKIMNEEIEINTKNILKSTHKIKINNDTKLYNIYKKETIDVVSLHSYRIYDCGNDFKITAISPDNTIEAIEHIDNNKWIVGVQFHPEINDDTIWKKFINEVNKRKEA